MTTREKEDAVLDSIRKILEKAEEGGLVCRYEVQVQFSRVRTYELSDGNSFREVTLTEGKKK